MIRTGDPIEIARLNELLGKELGRNERGESIFSWRWSEDLFWPASDTGRKEIVETKVRTPIIGAPAETHDYSEAYDAAADTWDDDFGGASGKCSVCGAPESDLAHNVYSIMQDLKPIYERGRQCRRVDTWLVAKWQSPEELIIGGLIGHGMGWQGGHKPSMDAMTATWTRLYPGVDFPAHGWRIPTDARLPRGPQDPTVPNIVDTQHFIQEVRRQTSMKFDARLEDMYAYEDRKDAKDRKLIEEDVRDGFNAFLNPSPGARGRASGGGFVSFPWSKKDRQ